MDIEDLKDILERELSRDKIQSIEDEFYEEARSGLDSIKGMDGPIKDRKEEKYEEYLSELLKARLSKILHEFPHMPDENLTKEENRIYEYMESLLSFSPKKIELKTQENRKNVDDSGKKVETEKESGIKEREEGSQENGKINMEDPENQELESEVENVDFTDEETIQKAEVQSKSETKVDKNKSTKGSLSVEGSEDFEKESEVEIKSVGYLLLRDTPEMLENESSKVGPFNEGDLVNLPSDVGEILVDRGVAEKIELKGL